jgi:LysR family nitrogen assimilation transcriptional regulator
MTLIQLANFIRIVELQSLSKAAAVVRIAQPALSRQVRALEAELGSPLLTRHGWGVTPTAAGEILVAHARRLLRETEAVRDAVHALAAEPTGRVGLGVPSSLAPSLLPAIGAALQARYPRLRPHFVDGFSATVHKRTLAGELDLAILYEDRAIGPLLHTPLLAENLVLVGPVGADIDPSRTSAELLAAMPLILPGRPNRLRIIVDQVVSETPQNVVLEVDSLPAIVGMVQRGQAFTVLPYSAVATEVEEGKIAVFPLEYPQLSRTLLLVRPAGRQPTASIAAVEDEIRTLVVSMAARMRWRPLFTAKSPP